MNNNDKLKSIVSDIIELIIDKYRYILSFLLLVILVMLMTFSDEKGLKLLPTAKSEVAPIEVAETPDTATPATVAEVEDPNPLILNEDEELNKFIKKYYKALENADIEKIRTYVDVLSDVEVNSIQQKARSREVHKNIKVYTKKGPQEDSLLAYVYLDLKFKNIKTTAPGIEPFYIKKESDGYVIINSKNSSAEDLEYTNEVEASEDVIELFAKTNDAYKEACAKDAELVKMLKDNGFEVPDLESKETTAEAKDTTTSDSTTASSGSGASSSSGSTSSSSSSSTSGTASGSSEGSGTSGGSSTASATAESIVGNTYILTDGVRVREKKTTNSQVKASGIKDDRVRVVAEYDGSIWIKVQLIAAGKSTYGYMNKEVLLKNAKLKN